MEKRGTLLHCLWVCKLVQPLWKTVLRSLRKLKLELNMQLSYDPAIALLGIYPREMKTYTHTQKSSTSMSIAFLLVTAKNWKQSRCPLMGKQLNKLQYIHTMEYYTPVKRKY